jgi:protein-tyrosine-phosphatase
MMTNKPVVLFVCVRNAGRSQMAEAIFNRRAEGRALARSAGSDPADETHPVVREALAEINIDISANKPKSLEPAVIEGVDVVVTMGCGDACPVIPGARVIDWELPDPADEPLLVVRTIRDQIERQVGDLLSELGATQV